MKAYGKAMKKALALSCLLALLLSLSPCAFAEGEIVVDTDKTVSDAQVYTGDLSITDTGSITFQPAPGPIHVSGSLSNAGSINSAKFVYAENELNNSGSISLDGKAVTISANGTLENSGSITAEGEDVTVYGGDSIVNQEGGSIGLNGTGVIIHAGDTLENSGSITAGGENVSVYGDSIVNQEGGSIEISASKVANVIPSKLENHGTVSVTGSAVDFTDNVENYNTITITKGGATKTYYGVNYVDENGGVTTALNDWENGEAGSTVNLKLKDNSETREGYNFFWQVGNDKYQAGSMLDFVVSGVTNIKALWDKIAAPAGSATVAELFEKQIDARVFDAERNELQQGEDYDCVFYTSLGRRVVQFTPEQLEAMEAGAHLFYILDENDAEWEYTIVKG